VRRSTIPALVVVVGVLLLADLLLVNASLSEIAGLAVDAAILVAAGVALAAVASLAMRRGGDLWRRRGDPVGAVFVLGGMAAVLIAGLRPGAAGAADPAVGWLVSAFMIPIGATLFALLFVTTIGASRRSLGGRSREAVVLVSLAVIVLILLLPIGGQIGDRLSGAAGWALAVPIGAVFRGMLIGVAILGAVLAARTILGVGTTDE
jgi:hypothetical protein